MKNLIFIAVLTFSILSVLHSEEAFQEDDNLIYAQVIKAEADLKSDKTWSFSVTILHKDEGWDHYADEWIILNPENQEILGSRILAHPHDNEQPFTRSLWGVKIPEDVDVVEIRAKCSLHPYKGKRVRIDLTR